MVDVLVRPSKADRPGGASSNEVGAPDRSGKSKKRSSSRKRNSLVEEDSGHQDQTAPSRSSDKVVQKRAPSKRSSAANSEKPKRHASGTSKDGTLSITSGSSHHSTSRNPTNTKRKAKAGTAATSTSASIGTGETKSAAASKNRKKPAPRAKSFDGSAHVPIKPPVRRFSQQKKLFSTSNSGDRNGNLRKQKSEKSFSALSIRSEDRDAHKETGKLLKQQKKRDQEKDLLKSMSHIESFQTPKQQIVHDLFVKRRSSKQSAPEAAIAAIPSLTPPGSSPDGNPSFDDKNNRSRKSKSDILTSSGHNKQNSDKDKSKRGKVPNPMSEGGNTPHLPRRQSSKLSAKRPLKTEKNKNLQNSAVPVRRISGPALDHDSDSDSSEHDESEYEPSTSQSEEIAKEDGHSSSADEEDDVRPRKAPGHAYYEASEKSISASTAMRGNNYPVATQTASASFEESRGLSILGSKSSLRTNMTRQTSSRSAHTFGTASTKSSTGNNSSGAPSQRPRNGSSQSSRSAQDIRKERASRQNKGTSSGTISQPESLLNTASGDDDSFSEEEEVFLSNTQTNNKSNSSGNSNSKGSGHNNNNNNNDNNNNSYQEEFGDDESDDAGTEGRNKSLCGLPPTIQSGETGKSNAMDSSFSSMPSLKSTDESVGTYMTPKKPGLLVTNTMAEAPMQHFLGGLTSAIEKKQTPGPDEKPANQAYNSSFNASFNASVLSSGHLARAAASALGPHPSQNLEDGMGDESLPSLMSFATESSKPIQKTLNLKSPPNQSLMGDESCPSLMSYGGRDDASMPSLASYRTTVRLPASSQPERLNSIRDDESLPSLWSMPDESQIISKPMSQLETVDSESDLNLESEDEDEKDGHHEEHNEENGYNDQGEGSQYSENEGSSYEESLTEEAEEEEVLDDNSFYGDDEEDEYFEENEEESVGEESAGEEDFDEDEGADGNDAKDNYQKPATNSKALRTTQSNNRAPGGKAQAQPQKQKKGKKGRKPSLEQTQSQQYQDDDYDNNDNENTAASQFVVKPKKKKKKSKGAKGGQKDDQLQKWKEEFEQEQLLEQQQEQMQQQILLQQQQMMQQQMMQQQYWMNGGGQPGGEHPGGYMMGANPGYMVDASGNMVINPAHMMMMMNNPGMVGMPGLSVASGALIATNSGHSTVASQSLQSYSDHQSTQGSQFGQATGVSKMKKSRLKKSQSLDYDFSFMDNPEMPQVDDVNADDVLKPMNPSQDEDDEEGNAHSKGKKKNKDKKGSLTSRFTKSVKKIMKPSAAGGGAKKSLIKTGQNDKQFFPDMDDDDDEEFTMQGLLSS